MTSLQKKEEGKPAVSVGKMTGSAGPLKFRVASHVVQDFGLNLYSSLPRVLVEFVANAHDADAQWAKVSMDETQIQQQRKIMRADYLAEVARAEAAGSAPPKPLKSRLLPPTFTITIEDNGHGMSREDLGDKFLVAGRRRRLEEGKVRTEAGRIIMGRKGLGKLAGFGVAHRVEVISRKKGEDHATRVVLDYDELIAKRLVDEVPLTTETISGGAGLPKGGGTRIVLSKLVYEAVKSRETTIEGDIADHFSSIKPSEFSIKFNGKTVEPTKRELAFGWPEPDLDPHALVEHTLQTEEGEKMTFKYRIRFVPRGKHLRASDRGVRVYANRRLASVPSLLDVKTGIHGFRNTEYLDGVVEADFIDQDVETDYIATDRQSLRWEVSQLQTLRAYLSEEMTKGCAEYQKIIDKENAVVTAKDSFTQKAIADAKLPKHRIEPAKRIASIIAGYHAGEVESQQYKDELSIILAGLSQGDILGALRKLSKQDHPQFAEVVERLTELTEREIGDFMKYVEGRLEGIEALQKLYKSADFKKSNNELQLHELLENNPWLIDPAFAQYVTSDVTEYEVLEKLEQELEVNNHVPDSYDPDAASEVDELGTNKRPDLVFLLSSPRMNRIVIVELKAPNTPLHHAHLGQLLGYIYRVKQWLKAKEYANADVRGLLIGSLDATSKAAEVIQLREAITQNNGNSWAVLDLGHVLENTRRIHRQLLDIRDRAAKAT